MKRWRKDDAEQKIVRDLVLGPGFYGPFSREGRYVYIDKGRLATILQKRYAVDTIMQRMRGDATCIEEKIVRGVYEAVTLETMSCTIPGHESPGWMEYGKADWLNWTMCRPDGNVDVHLFDFLKLQEVFWPAEKQFPVTITEQDNETLCRIVPIEWITAQGVGYFTKTIYATPEGQEAVKAYLRTHYKRGKAA